jgi:hypothetical protein
VEDLVHRLRSSALFVALSSLSGACFVETPGLDEQDTTTGSPCQLGHMSCACYGNGTCEAGLVCNPDVQLCIPESCNPGEIDCVCNDGACLPGLACESGLCVDAGSSSTPSTTDDDSSPMPDSSGEETHGTEETTAESTSDPTTGEDTLPLDESSSDDASDPTGDSCEVLACEDCVDCVDTQDCSAQFEACDDEGGCITAVACLVDCAVSGDCLDPCCEGLSVAQKAAISALVLCKSDQCIDTCNGQAEFDTCG